MKYILLFTTMLFAGELEVDGNLKVTGTVDANGNPIGLKSSVQTGETSSGNLRVILRHLPKKTAEGVPEGFIENAGGSTDVEVEFSPTIQ